MKLGEISKWFRERFFKSVSEQRKYPRVPISVKVTNLNSGNFTYYQATNISVGGMFVKADEPPADGTPLQIQFTLPESDEALDIEAIVIRVQHAALPGHPYPSGMGLKFINPPESFKKSVESFVRKKI